MSCCASEGGHGYLVAKIERSEALVNLDRIIQASDAVMVARGDLGVEVGYAELTGPAEAHHRRDAASAIASSSPRRR